MSKDNYIWESEKNEEEKNDKIPKINKRKLMIYKIISFIFEKLLNNLSLKMKIFSIINLLNF